MALLTAGADVQRDRIEVDVWGWGRNLRSWLVDQLTLVERRLGPSTMLSTARFLLIDPPRQQQRPFSMFLSRFDHGDAAVLRLQHHLHAHAAEEQSLTVLAALAGMAERTLQRRFAKATGLRPTEYLQQVPISKAREVLERTNRSVDQIAWQVGYQDPAAFRKVFQKYTGLAPNLYRQRFAIRPGSGAGTGPQ